MNRALLFRLLLLVGLVAASPGRVKLVVHGESFRTHSAQRSRESGVSGYAQQKQAVRSVLLNLVLPLVLDMGYAGVDVHLHTQNSSWLGELSEWYSPFLASEADVTTTAAGKNWYNTFNGSVFEPPGRYEAVVFVRPDLILKPLFRCALASANRSNILFAFREWKRADVVGDPNNKNRSAEERALARVVDTVTWIPSRLFPYVQNPNCLVNNHDAMLCAANWVGSDSVGFLLPAEQHDSDSAKDWNPLYRMASRDEGAEDASSVALDWSHLCAQQGILDA